MQEEDLNSKRSYFANQVEAVGGLFGDYDAFVGINYDVFFVPIPIFEPMGKVKSGLFSLSRHAPVKVDRHSLPGNYSWPMKLFMLDRCFLVKRFPVSNGRELLVINTHNSAYDDGSLRKAQIDTIIT